jgi:hypothetical protein
VEADRADPQSHEALPGTARIGHPGAATVTVTGGRRLLKILSGSILTCATGS